MTEHIISVSPWFPPIDPLSHSFSKRRRTEGTLRTRRWNQCQGPCISKTVLIKVYFKVDLKRSTVQFVQKRWKGPELR